MIKAEVVFDDDYIFLNGKYIWLHGESQNFAIGDKNEDCDDGGDIDELFTSLEQAISYCMENKND